MKSRCILLLVLGVALIVLMVFVYKSIFPEPRNIQEQPIDFSLSAEKLGLEMADSDRALQYGDKVIHTYGKISSVDGNVVTLNKTIVVHLLDPTGHVLKEGDSISLKGRCIGYDDLLGEVKLDQASIVQTK